MLMLDDAATWIAILGVRGADVLPVETSNLSISFRSCPAPRDLVAHVKLLKCGGRLSFGEAEVDATGADSVVANATATQARPGQ